MNHAQNLIVISKNYQKEQLLPLFALLEARDSFALEYVDSVLGKTLALLLLTFLLAQ
jgi:hypothetical protein